MCTLTKVVHHKVSVALLNSYNTVCDGIVLSDMLVKTALTVVQRYVSLDHSFTL